MYDMTRKWFRIFNTRYCYCCHCIFNEAQTLLIVLAYKLRYFSLSVSSYFLFHLRKPLSAAPPAGSAVAGSIFFVKVIANSDNPTFIYGRWRQKDFCFVAPRSYSTASLHRKGISDAKLLQDTLVLMPVVYQMQKKCYFIDRFNDM